MFYVMKAIDLNTKLTTAQNIIHYELFNNDSMYMYYF